MRIPERVLLGTVPATRQCKMAFRTITPGHAVTNNRWGERRPPRSRALCSGACTSRKGKWKTGERKKHQMTYFYSEPARSAPWPAKAANERQTRGGGSWRRKERRPVSVDRASQAARARVGRGRTILYCVCRGAARGVARPPTHASRVSSCEVGHPRGGKR
jgi:hypothetical protein